MAQPISALADAVAQLDDEDRDVKPQILSSGEEENDDDDDVQIQSENGRTNGEPPAKKSRLNNDAPAASPSPDHLDLVAKELVSDKDARELVALWMKECQGFCSLLDPAYDTYDALRKRSAFLFNVVLYTALRARGRNAPPSKELLAAAEETRRFARDQVFRTPSLEDVQGALTSRFPSPLCTDSDFLRSRLHHGLLPSRTVHLVEDGAGFGHRSSFRDDLGADRSSRRDKDRREGPPIDRSTSMLRLRPSTRCVSLRNAPQPAFLELTFFI
jgi:hypothetical protein